MQGGVVVIFQVAERPLLKEVCIVGNDIYLTKVAEARGRTQGGRRGRSLRGGKRPSQDQGILPEKGYSKVRVTVLEGDKVGDLRAMFVVNEGPQQKVFWVKFDGNHFVSAPG